MSAVPRSVLAGTSTIDTPLDAILQRSVMIALAVGGAVIATIGSLMLRRGSRVSPRFARLVLRLGYALAWASVAVFIAMGFRGG